jgi:uncharacterized protein (TIGR02246 family)
MAPEPLWIGDFSESDREEIVALRNSIIDALVCGDAEAYAAACTEDVLLLHPDQDIVSGLDAFREYEAGMFQQLDIATIELTPVRIERSSDLVYEVGRQLLEMRASQQLHDRFKGSRKYTHVLRRTPSGWRFAALMSNNSE